MTTNIKVLAPLTIGILFMVFSAVILLIGDFISDWKVAFIPVILGAVFLAIASKNAGKGK